MFFSHLCICGCDHGGIAGYFIVLRLRGVSFFQPSKGSGSVKIRLFPYKIRLVPQTDHLAFRQIELCDKSASVQIELSFEFSGRQQAADGVNVP